jgi:hypothetical protein
MSWNSKHSIGWTDAWISRCDGWIQQPRNSKLTVGWTDDIGSDSSDALVFGNNTNWVSMASAPDDPTVDSTVHLTLTFKSYRDTQKNCFSTGWTDASESTWQFIRCLCLNYIVLHRVGALQHRMVRRGISALTGSLGSTAISMSMSDRMIRHFHRGDHRFIWRYYFSGKLFQRLASLDRLINMTPYNSWAAFAILKIYSSQWEKESVFLPFGILFIFIEELFLSDQWFSRCIHGLVECSGQVKVCGLVTLRVWRLLDGLGALGFLVSSWRVWERQESLVYTVRDPPFRRWRTGTLSEHLSLGDLRGSNTLSECSNMD